MKKLKKILLINWLYFTKQLIELDDVNFLTGKNGAGKSTVIDALQIVLLGETNSRNFNNAANGNSQRTLDGYLRADMDEKNPRSRRGKDFSSYIACEYLDDYAGSSFVTGVVFDCRSDGSRRDQFFIYDGAIPENCFIQGRQPMTIAELRQYLKSIPNSHGKLYDTQSQYRLDLLAKWNVHKEQTFRMLKKAVSFQPIVDIQKFITENICDLQERPDIEAMQQNIRDYKRHEALAERQQQKLERLIRIQQDYQGWQTALDRYSIQRFLVLWAEKEDLQGRIDATEAEITDCQARLHAIDGENDHLDEEKQRLRNRRDQLSGERANSDIFKEKIRLEEQIKKLSDDQTVLATRLNKAALEIKNESVTLHRRTTEILDWPAETSFIQLQEAALRLFQAVAPFSDFNIELFSSDEAMFQRVYSESVSFSAAVRDTAYSVETRLADLRQQQDSTEATIEQLRRNIKDYPKGLLSLKEDLQRKLSSEFQAEIPVEILADVLEIADGEEKWRGAVEGYLNTQKFYLLVPVRAYAKAVSIYDSIKQHYRKDSFGLVDVGQIRSRERLDSAHNSLASKIETKNDLARSYVDYLLGKVVCAASSGDLRKFKAAITSDGMLYQGYVVRPIRQELMQNAYIGQKSIALRMKQMEAQLSTLRTEIAEWTPFGQTLSQLSARDYLFTQRFIQGELSDRRSDYQRGLQITKDLAEIEETLGKIDLSWLLEMEDQIAQIDLKIKDIEKQRDRNNVEYGGLQNRIRSIGEQTLPDLYDQLIHREDDISDSFTESYQQNTGIPRYLQELERLQKASVVARNFGNRLAQTQQEVDNSRGTLLRDRGEYVRTFQPCSFYVDAVDNDEFSVEKKKLEESELPQYREKIQQARDSAMEQFQNDFLAKLKSSIDQVQEQVKSLNRVLKNGQFGSDKYRFIAERNPDYADYYDMIMSPDLMEGDGGLFALPFQQKYGPLIEELFSRIATSDDTQLNARKQSELQQNIERYTDFRTYMRFDLETTDQNGNVQMLSKTLNMKSGGETQTPFYIAVLASFAQLYQVTSLSGPASNTMRLVVFDEAFNKMDSDRIIESVRLLRKMNLQAIICTPPDKLPDIAPQADRTLLVGKKNYTMHILPYSKEVPNTWSEQSF